LINFINLEDKRPTINAIAMQSKTFIISFRMNLRIFLLVKQTFRL
jgi:hypothetical protein